MNGTRPVWVNTPKGQRCKRCGKKYRGRGDWNAELRNGVVLYLLCPRCQTPEENAEAAIREATTVYGRDAFGRVTGRPKGEGVQP